jgi:hypothetical protein
VAVVLSAEPAPVEVAGLAWACDSADPLGRAAPPEAALAAVAGRAYRQAGIIAGIPLVETTERNVFRLCISAAGLGLAEPAGALDALLGDGLPTLNAAGGRFAGEAMFAAGLERIAHASRAVVAGGAESAVAHSSYGRAGQGQLVTVLRRTG